jgi:hypothetical protein
VLIGRSPEDRLFGGSGRDRILPHKLRFRSRVTIQRDEFAHFFGRVQSDGAVCERNRTVVLVNENFGEVAEARTDANGRWSVRMSKVYFGRHYAKVDRKVTEVAICDAARSGAV